MIYYLNILFLLSPWNYILIQKFSTGSGMENSSLIKLLKTFSKSEWKEFISFVNSSFFNKEKVLIKFAECLLKNPNGFNLSKEKIFDFLYPGMDYNDNLFRNIQSDLLKLAEEYLAIQNVRTNKKEMLRNLLIQLNKKNSSSFGKVLKKAILISENEKNEDSDHYLYKYQIEMLNELHLGKTEHSYVKDFMFEKKKEYLLTYFLINFLSHRNSELNSSKIIRNYNSILTLEKELDILMNNEGIALLKNEYLKTLYYEYKLLKNDEEVYFDLLKKILLHKSSSLSQPYLSELFSLLSNFAYTKVLKGEIHYIRHQFDLNFRFIESGIYKNVKGFITHVQFMNTVITGLESGENDLVRKIISVYGNDLHPVHKETTLNFCEALISFKEKNYDEAISLVSVIETEDFFFKQQLKSLYLKIYYELNEYEPFYFHFDSYKHFVRQNKLIHESVKKQLNGYLNFTKYLFDLKNKPSVNMFELKLLEKNIKESKSLVNIKWLLEKMKELKK